MTAADMLGNGLDRKEQNAVRRFLRPYPVSAERAQLRTDSGLHSDISPPCDLIDFVRSFNGTSSKQRFSLTNVKMALFLGLIILFSICLEQSGKTEAVADVIHSLSHQTAPVSAVHWPAMSVDRSGGIDGRLERSLFGSGTNSGTCSDQSEISENTIIRTKDSRALGARFLNETSLGADARDRCLNLCCSFHGCNVAVYEEKVRRSSSSITAAQPHNLDIISLLTTCCSQSIFICTGRRELLSFRLRTG